MKLSRSQFLKVMGTGALSLPVISSCSSAASDNPAPAEDHSLDFGLASYTLRKFDLDGVIQISKRLQLNSIALKSMHMPLDASPESLKEAAEKVRNAGLNLYGAGVIYMKTQEEVQSAFEYANTLGIKTIVGVPNHELLPLVEELVKKYDIKLAIHNHGPGDDLYSSPHDVWAKIESLDPRVGFCIDVGHVVRIGQDPVPMIEQYKDRLYDMHIKDVDKAEPEGDSVEIGRGVIDIPRIVQTLKKIRYQGAVALEYEKDGDDPVPGLAESIGYVRGIARLTTA